MHLPTKQPVVPDTPAELDPPFPSIWTIIFGVFLGWLAGGLALLLLAAGVSFLGADYFLDNGGGSTFPYPIDGSAAVSAALAAWFISVSVISFVVAQAVSERIKRPVSMAWVAASFALFGTVPYLSSSSLLAASPGGAFIAVVLVIRFLAIGNGYPADRAAMVRARARYLWVLLGAVGVALLWLIGFGMTHPIWNKADFSDAQSADSQDDPVYGDSFGNGTRLVMRLPNAQAVYYSVELSNSGPLNASLTKLVGVESSPPGGAVLQRISASGIVTRPAEPLKLALDGHGDAAKLRLKIGFNCDYASSSRIKVDALDIRYRLLGRDWTQTVPLRERLEVLCPPAR